MVLKLSDAKENTVFDLPDLENLVQSSEHGVIVVTFGSNVKYLPDQLIIKMVNAFGKRKELFLMRFNIHFFHYGKEDSDRQLC